MRNRAKHSRSISTMIVLLMAFLILPLNVLVIASTAQSIGAIQGQAQLSIQSVANLYMQQLDNRVKAIHYYFYALSDSDVDFIRLSRGALGDAYTISKTAVVRNFLTSIQTESSADGYFIEAADGLSIVIPNALENVDGIIHDHRAALSDALLRMDLSATAPWSILEADGRRYLLRVYREGGFRYGAMISLDGLERMIRSAVDYEDLTVRLDEISAQAQRGWLTAQSASSRIDFGIQLSTPVLTVLRTLPAIQWVGIALAGLYLLLIPALILTLNRILIRPLRRIQLALGRLKQGEREHRIGRPRAALEFQSIYQSFDDMADNLERLKIENYEKELARQKMELRNLQLQIRPHFLLNTFNLMFSLAQTSEYRSIQKMLLYLSDYFRYIFRSGKELARFSQEFELIQRYLEISAVRYPGCFEASYDVDDAVLAVSVPPLLIHNFVENIINHCLRFGALVRIHIGGRYDGKWAEFVVKDDGPGMEAEVADSINRGEFQSADESRVHVGIKNAYQRVQCFFGPESVLRVDSAPGRGSAFTIGFPYDKSREA